MHEYIFFWPDVVNWLEKPAVIFMKARICKTSVKCDFITFYMGLQKINCTQVYYIRTISVFFLTERFESSINQRPNFSSILAEPKSH